MRRIPGIAWRALWRSAAVLLVFAQVAAAADLCLPERLAGQHLALADTVADAHYGFDEHCATGLMPADQAPAPEAKRVAPELGVIAPITWSLERDTDRSPAPYALARTGPSLRLQFRNLRL